MFYYLDKRFYLHPVLNWGILLAYLPFMWKSAEDHIALSTETVDLRSIIRPAFITFLLISLGFYLLFYSLHLYDKELLQITQENQIRFLEEEISRGVGDPQQANHLRDQIQYLKNQGMSMPLGPVLLQMCVGAIGGFGLSALIAFILQSRNR